VVHAALSGKTMAKPTNIRQQREPVVVGWLELTIFEILLTTGHLGVC